MVVNIRVNAWEPDTGEQALLALAGHSTMEEVLADRKARASELISVCAITPDKVGFEIGSGTGLVAAAVSPHCARLDCNDISASFLARAAETCAACANVDFHLITDFYLAHLPHEAYDFGFSFNVFIHFNPYDIFNYLQEVARLLKPGGMFYFDACTIGDATVGQFKEQAAMYQADPSRIRGLLNYNSPETIGRIITEAGLHPDALTLTHASWLKVLVTKRKDASTEPPAV